MRITSKGQVTIPQAVRERAGLLPNTEVEFLVDGDLVHPRDGRTERRGRADSVRDWLVAAPAAAIAASFRMTTDRADGRWRAARL